MVFNLFNMKTVNLTEGFYYTVNLSKIHNVKNTSMNGLIFSFIYCKVNKYYECE